MVQIYVWDIFWHIKEVLDKNGVQINRKNTSTSAKCLMSTTVLTMNQILKEMFSSDLTIWKLRKKPYYSHLFVISYFFVVLNVQRIAGV